jgi:ABC-type lipoprotein release transport system permease subunit
VRGISEADIQKLPSLNNENLRTALKEQGIPDEKASFMGFDASEGVAIGERMAWRHQLGLGSSLTIISPEGPDTMHRQRAAHPRISRWLRSSRWACRTTTRTSSTCRWLRRRITS